MPNQTAGLEMLAAKLGVAASELWALWLSLWWRPWLDVGVCVVIALACALAARRFYRWHCNLEASDRYNDDPGPLIGMWLVGVLGSVVLFVALTTIPDAIVYTISHEAYAIDQLRAVVGR